MHQLEHPPRVLGGKRTRELGAECGGGVHGPIVTPKERRVNTRRSRAGGDGDECPMSSTPPAERAAAARAAEISNDPGSPEGPGGEIRRAPSPETGPAPATLAASASWCPLRRLGRRLPALEPRDQVVQLQLLQALAYRVQLGRGVLDQGLALAAQVERLAQAGLVRVQAGDDLLEPFDGALVGLGLSAHVPPSFSATRAPTVPSASRRSKLSAARTAAAPASGSPAPSSTSA